MRFLALSYAFLALISATGGCHAASVPELKFFVDLSRIKRDGAAESNSKTGGSCGQVVPPLTDMARLRSFYRPDHTQSVIDRAAMGRYMQRVGLADRIKQNLLTTTRRYITQREQRPSLSKCLVQQLKLWAENDAMLKGIEDNDPLGRRIAIMVQAWAVPALTTAFLLTRGDPETDEKDKLVIALWLQKLKLGIRKEFEPPPSPRPKELQWLDLIANHREWAAAAVGTLAAATNDPSDFAWSMDQLKLGLKASNPDGSLPPELTRGSKALHYHAFALQALSLLTRLADANGVVLSGSQEDDLQKIVLFAFRAYGNPDLITQKTGVTQETNQDDAVWMVMIHDHFAKRNQALASGLTSIGNSIGSPRVNFLGIDVDWFR